MSTLGDFLHGRLRAAVDRYDQLTWMLELARDLALVDPAEGLEHAERALALALEPYDASAAASAYCERGLCRLGLGDPDGALADLTNAERIFTDQENNAALARVALGIGEVQMYRGNYRSAVSQYETCLAAAARADDPLIAIAAQQGLGAVFMAVGDHERAMEEYQAAARSARNAEDRGTLGALLSDMGQLAVSRGDHAGALDKFRQALQLFDDPRHERLMVRTLVNIANMLYALDDLNAAMVEAQRAWFIARSLGETRQGIVAMSTIGNILEKEGDVAGALEQHQRALGSLDVQRAYGGMENRRLQTTILLNIGNLYRKLGDDEHAIVVLQEVTQFAGMGGEAVVIYRAHAMLAEVYEGRRDFERAFIHMKRVHTLREEVCNAEREHTTAAMQARFDLERMMLEKQQLEEALEIVSGEREGAGLVLIERQGLIEHIERNLKEIKRHCTGTARQLVTQLERELRSSKAALSRQEELVRQWMLIDREYIRRLAQFCPKLSGHELVTCELTAGGMQTKDIAKYRHLTERAVEKTRGSIRKKLAECGLKPGDDLAAFLARI